MKNPYTGAECAHEIKLADLTPEAARNAASHAVIYSEEFNKDGTVTLTGWFSVESEAKTWERNYSPPKTNKVSASDQPDKSASKGGDDKE